LGGCSLRGGEGSILGIVLGTALLQVLQNLVNILGIPNSLNFAVMGTVILLGVLADRQLQSRRQRKMALASVARTTPGATLLQGQQSGSPRGTAALPTGTADRG
jgi:ribose transport system permease protein